jgi:hypothetical protein
MGYVPVRTPLLCHDGEVVNGNAADGTYHFCAGSANTVSSGLCNITTTGNLSDVSFDLGSIWYQIEPLPAGAHSDMDDNCVPKSTCTCPYCGMANDPEWLTCGQGQWWGCGAPLKENDNAPRVTRNVMQPGISAREFEKTITEDDFLDGLGYSRADYERSFYGQLEMLDEQFQELKAEIGEQFMKAISRTLGPLLKAVR